MNIVFFNSDAKSQINDFVLKHNYGNIHQTYEWGEFQSKNQGIDKFFTLGVKDKQNKLRATAVLLKYTLMLGLSWLYCPRGPLTTFNTEVSRFLFNQIDQIAKKERSVFLRIDPMIQNSEIFEHDDKKIIFHELFPGFCQAHTQYQPQWTLQINLQESEDKILAQMKPKGRYNIRLAERKGIKIISSNFKTHTSDKKFTGFTNEELIEQFYKLLLETTQRDKFSSHDKNYYWQIVNSLGPSDMIKLYSAVYNKKIIAGILVTYFKNTVTYYFGASGNEHRELKAPSLLQWTAMKEVKQSGYKWYDLFGIAPPDASENHPWFGVSEFKKKFGGQIIHYIPAMEKIYKPLWYNLLKFYKFLKKI